MVPFLTVTLSNVLVISKKGKVLGASAYPGFVEIKELLGGEVECRGEYPAWEYKVESDLRPLIQEVYADLFGKEPTFCAIHAGLECGILSEKIKGLDCVSFGPTNYDIHTPKERLSISSTQRYWDFLVELLKRAK